MRSGTKPSSEPPATNCINILTGDAGCLISVFLYNYFSAGNSWATYCVNRLWGLLRCDPWSVLCLCCLIPHLGSDVVFVFSWDRPFGRCVQTLSHSAPAAPHVSNRQSVILASWLNTLCLTWAIAHLQQPPPPFPKHSEGLFGDKGLTSVASLTLLFAKLHSWSNSQRPADTVCL